MFQVDLKVPLPWFKFYVGDVLRRVEDMDARQFGAYMLLLMYYWNHSRLPAESNMPRVARVDAKAWRSMKDIVLPRVQEDVQFLDEEKDSAQSSRSSSKERSRRYRQRHGAVTRDDTVTTRLCSESDSDSESLTDSVASQVNRVRTNESFHRPKLVAVA